MTKIKQTLKYTNMPPFSMEDKEPEDIHGEILILLLGALM